MRLVKLDLWLMEGTLLVNHLKLHYLRWWDDADRHIAEARRVVAEVDCECAIDVVHNLACHQQVELQGLDAEVEVTPAKDLLGLHGSFEGRFALGVVACLIQEL